MWARKRQSGPCKGSSCCTYEWGCWGVWQGIASAVKDHGESGWSMRQAGRLFSRPAGWLWGAECTGWLVLIAAFTSHVELGDWRSIAVAVTIR